ncbi:MAG: YciI family protein [Bacteriovoracia bacterium]
MFIVLLKFSTNKSKAPSLMAAHNEWIKKGLDDGNFLIVGSLKPNLGGVIVAHNITKECLEKKVSQDPFVVENIVSVELLEISPSKVSEGLTRFLES